jgi:uncharacterized protein YbjT (DUF2867 family)
MILVVGATGTNGREVVQQLVAGGAKVRAMVRNPSRAPDLATGSVEVVAGDLDQPSTLAETLKGVDRAFFVSGVDPRYPQFFRNFLGAAVQSGSPQIVKLSGLGADRESSVELLRQHGQTDDDLAASGLRFTILRPNSFFQNLLWSVGTIKDHGAFYLPVGSARQSLVDVRDIAAVAALALTSAGHQGKIYEITGPRSLTYGEVAEALSSVLGKPVRYVDVPPAAALEAMLSAGTPEWNARAVVELYGEFAAGHAAQTTDTVERLLGRPPLTIEQFARDHASAFA